MNHENIAAFFEGVKSNPEMQEKIAESREAASRFFAEALAKLSQEAGTPFTAEEFYEVSKARAEELTDADLQDVAGGARVIVNDMTMDWVHLR